MSSSMVPSGLISRLALIFVAFSCSLPLLLMLHAPPLSGQETDIQFPGSDRRQHLRSIADRALQMLPSSHERRGEPLPSPLDVADQADFHVAFPDTDTSATAKETGFNTDSVAPSKQPDNEAYQIKNAKNLAMVLKHDENESSESMLSRMSDPPAMEDVIKYLDTFVGKMHNRFLELKDASKFEIYEAYRALAEKVLLPFDEKWRGRNMYPVRHGEGSIFLSIASYRDHRLENTLKEAFSKAQHPEKLFVGVVMQNCFENCKTGVHRVSPLGEKPVRTEISDAPPDANGVEDFCNSGLPYSKYCENGQVRLMAVREAEALGPCIARYFASKLWGGEEYFVQIDSHIWFVQDWDVKLVNSMRIAPSAKPVISTYPPGYGGHWEGKPGPRMCGASFSSSPVEARIIRLGSSQTSAQLPGPENEPIPAAYVAAGFFAAPSDFLKDLPFDPFLPWVFMGEEIMLSSRFFTNGYDIFAPRENILAHEYRPGSMGLPKFWETVGRVFGRPSMNTMLMHIGICRVKNHLGYPECLEGGADLHEGVLFAKEAYGMGKVRSLQQFLDFAAIDMKEMHIESSLKWCMKGEQPPMDGWAYSTVLD